MFSFLHDPDLVKAWGPVFIGTIVALISMISLLVTSCIQLHLNRTTIRHFEKSHRESQAKVDREEILKKLNQFYSPFKELRTESRVLYDFFALDEKERCQAQGKDFRTIEFLAQGYKFHKKDEALLDQILNVGLRQIGLIEEHAASLDNAALAELLGRLASHIRILTLARTGALNGMETTLGGIVFPREVDGAMESEILRLQERYHQLKHDREDQVDQIPSGIDSKTIEFYDQNATTYLKDTESADLLPIYREFLRGMPRGARILDAGCGTGRDTRFFIRRGHTVLSVDPSIEMVHLCQRYPFAYCQRKSFMDLDFKEEFDGVWACASLIHVNRNELRPVLVKLRGSLLEGGFLYFSLKEGEGNSRSKGRYFEYYSNREIEDLVADIGGLVLKKSWKNESALISDKTQWLNFIYVKAPLSINAARSVAPRPLENVSQAASVTN